MSTRFNVEREKQIKFKNLPANVGNEEVETISFFNSSRPNRTVSSINHVTGISFPHIKFAENKNMQTEGEKKSDEKKKLWMIFVKLLKISKLDRDKERELLT